MEERLQKILARAGFASRRGAETLMLEGRVTKNGELVRELGTKADLATDDIRVDGVRVKAPKGHVYLVLNKPRGVVTTRNDPERRQTVMDLVPAVAGLFPVGRLDVTTEGLILLTNDGSFAERVSHPRYEVPRVYHAKVHRVPDAQALQRLQQGVKVDGDFMAVDRARVINSDNNAWVEVTLHEGKQHEVKRLLEAVGHPVSKLRRVAIGPVTSRGLEPGEFRALLARGDRGAAPRSSRGRPQHAARRGPTPALAAERRPPRGGALRSGGGPPAVGPRAPGQAGRASRSRRGPTPAGRSTAPAARAPRAAARGSAMSRTRAAGFVFPAHLEGLDRFEAGKPIAEVERELGLHDVVKLASNENPLGPSPRAVEAAHAALAGVNRYPDPQATELRRALSLHLGVPVEQILAGNGSVEIIDLVARALLGPGDNAVISEHAFVRFRQIVAAHNHGARLVPMRDWTHDLEAMAAAIDSRTRLVFVANPNNPTGTWNRRRELEALVRPCRPRACWCWTRRTSSTRKTRTTPTASSSCAAGRRCS